RGGLKGLLHIAGYVEACRAAVRASGIEPPLGLIGLSMGAMVAIEWSARHRDEIAACVLINPSARPFGAPYERLRARRYLTLARLILFEHDQHAREVSIHRLTSTQRAKERETAELWA